MEHRDTGVPHQQKLLGISKWQDYGVHNLCVHFLVSFSFPHALCNEHEDRKERK